MKDILALFKREAEYEPGSVDEVEDQGMYGRTRVLENGGERERGAETTAPRPPRKAGSLGFRKEDSVYGRR